MLEPFLSGVGRALVTVELNTEIAIRHPCAWCQRSRRAWRPVRRAQRDRRGGR